jgi:hypothetical protein
MLSGAAGKPQRDGKQTPWCPPRIAAAGGNAAATEAPIMQQIKPPTAEVYRIRAQRTRDLIPHMETPTTRANLLRMAEQYEHLAQQVERQPPGATG